MSIQPGHWQSPMARHSRPFAMAACRKSFDLRNITIIYAQSCVDLSCPPSKLQNVQVAKAVLSVYSRRSRPQKFT